MIAKGLTKDPKKNSIKDPKKDLKKDSKKESKKESKKDNTPNSVVNQFKHRQKHSESTKKWEQFLNNPKSRNLLKKSWSSKNPKVEYRNTIKKLATEFHKTK